MKQSKMLIPTLRDVPADADIKSHQLLLRAGFMRQTASGVYSYLPLAKKVLQKVEQIVREEMDAIDGSELLMPTLQPAELWQETGRWYNYGSELFRIKDRHARDFALGPTHEEVITSLVRDEINSYKKLPLVLYQIQTKFRDEARPRFGLLRGREFIMKDAYSFHASKESLDEAYNDMVKAYSNIFRRCGLNFRAVIADSGAIGGKNSQEFMVLTDVGEDTIAFSNESDFAANVEMAPVHVQYEKSNEELATLEKIETKNQKTIEEISRFLNVAKEKCLKSLLFKVDEKYVLVVVRGDHEVNDIKVKNLLDAKSVELASSEETLNILKAEVGSVGPIGLTEEVDIIADYAVQSVVNGVCGANETDYHYTGVNIGRDFQPSQIADLRFIQEGDPSPDGKGTIQFAEGIEVGHVFKLGTVYSESMKATYLDENGKSQPMIMGCYGIGVSRTVAAIVEQHHDENGIIWPVSVTPFEVHLIPINMKTEAQKELADQIYNKLNRESVSVLYDDRNERPGVKFADSDLFGFPIRITVGKKAEEGIVELKLRKSGETLEVAIDNIVDVIKKQLNSY
ncbi:prolyl-tRNA synthetase [Schinkia azotoformans MEV2011]|uniref:Proline--tRNA ligase n=1 Tax=Schinkia azotoformans MEV2011 TaxID=1348973 RepID=A0A072NSQ0_SCHAZ|nr:proline--tRNA ligase [Schinkia azotoformans]KEF39913.1 prolyl-tRNA synthetase [Schinkia azotoformans MEV2011]MEC1697212.1 proline--tRNA ligase [Schinkia azotoformans]MEC1724251.1 proline--tRNA ligase [Schinkia azotoformans]MEC1771455.1 proline--tRNA ligase [Schinkia azotoformans]MEC1778919.1 proline--tRNA ligase [Schinkia azotoformans]